MDHELQSLTSRGIYATIHCADGRAIQTSSAVRASVMTMYAQKSNMVPSVVADLLEKPISIIDIRCGLGNVLRA